MWASRGGGRETGRENLKHTAHYVGLDLTTQEIMTWAETKSQMLNWLSHPGAPVALNSYIRKEKGLKLSDLKDPFQEPKKKTK